jgi:UPF0176 protein
MLTGGWKALPIIHAAKMTALPVSSPIEIATDIGQIPPMMNKTDAPDMAAQGVPVPQPDGAHEVVVAAFYKFVALPDFETLQSGLQKHCEAASLFGTILLAGEGINGTICGSHAGVQALMGWFAADPRFADIAPKFSFAPDMAFHRMKVRLKREIVTMGQADIDPVGNVGTYVSPEAWNALIDRDDTLLIDTRNDYEVAIGSFENAIDPKTASFRDFPAWVDNYLESLPDTERPKNIAMFCTGGIRCEKATAYLVGKGYENVFHLQGGILKYLENVPEQDSKWQGDCFVFDQRVSVRHGLSPGDYDMCHACRMPLTAADKQNTAYEHGVACPHCIDRHSDNDRARFRERQKQIRLARQRGQQHIGGRDSTND